MGTKEDNPEETRLEMPQGMEADAIHEPSDYDFAYGAARPKGMLAQERSSAALVSPEGGASSARRSLVQGDHLCKAWGCQAQGHAWVERH